MTLDLLEILIDFFVKALASIEEINHWISLVFIVCVLGIGTISAISSLTKDLSFNFLSNLF